MPRSASVPSQVTKFDSATAGSGATQPGSVTSNGTTNDVLVYVAGAAAGDVAAGRFDQRERCGLEDDRLGDLFLYPVALIVDHVEA